MLQEGIYARLAADGTVSGLVGTRIYPAVIPQGASMPCVVYSVSGKSRQVRFAGTDSLVDGTLQVDSFAKTYAGAVALADAVRASLVDFSGTLTGNGSPQTTTPVKKIFIESEREIHADEPGLYRVSQVYTVWYDEA